MKILYILEDGRLGGMNKMILEIASRIRDLDFDTEILMGESSTESILSVASKLNIEVSLIPIRFLSRSPKELIAYAIFFIPDLIRIIQKLRLKKPNLVYCNGSQQIKGIIAARLLGINAVWHMHDTYQPKLLLSLFHIVKWTLGIKNFIASSKRTIKFYNLPIDTTLLSVPPVNTNEFVPIPNNSKLRDTFNIISIANVNPDKGLDTLIYTAAKVSEAVSNTYFSIIGLIPETQKHLFTQLNALISILGVKNVVFLGQRTDIKELLAKSDLYLCTSNNESGPISVFEAMAMGIPVVSTDVGDLKELFDRNNSGIIQPIKDSDALSKSIVKLIKNTSELKSLGERGRLTAVNLLDIENSITIHKKFYQKIVSEV